jgi:cardiolipin synthase
VLAALRRAVDRGVKIRVVHEPAALGSRCDLFGAEAGDKSEGCKAERDLKEAIVASGGSFVPFQKDVFCADPAKPCFLHGKMVIADGQAALVSTGNFNSSNLCNRSRDPKVCNRDFSVVSRDAEVVQFLSAVAENDLAQKSYDLSSMFTPSLKDKVTVSPFSLDPLVALVDSAVRSIRIENQYLTEPTLNAAIMAAARRGVHVEVTVASLCSFGPPNPKQKEASATLFTDFERAGIDVRLLPSQFQIGGRPGYLHAKAMVIDGASAWVGSVNGSWSALSNNREFGLFFSNAEAVAPLEKILADDHASTDMETWQESLACAKDPHVLQP